MILILDLGVPLRFWHMVVASERVPALLFKPWSPISLGIWILTLFGLFSSAAYIWTLVETGRLRWALGRGVGRLARASRLEGMPSGADRDRLAQASAEGAWEVLAAAVSLNVDPDVLAIVLDWAARPALRAAAAAVGPLVLGAHWSRGHCPACGALPTRSVMRGKERERRLLCGRCGTGWAFPRVRCPSCGGSDHERMGYLHAAGEGEHRRAEVCDGCGGYVKSVALLDDPDADRLLQLDLETAALDFLALEGGYTRHSIPSSSQRSPPWGAARSNSTRRPSGDQTG